MINFRFGLLPVEEIQPWGGVGESPRLSWFGLTDGWYCVDVAGHELLRYVDRAPHPPDGEQGGRAASSYVDYFVVRFWEDILEMVPRVMEPVPEDLVAFVSGDETHWASADTSEAEEAADWHSHHYLDMGHLRNPSELRWWRTVADGEDVMTVSWQHEPGGGIEFTAPAKGRVTLPTASFVAAVTELDRALLAVMEQRVTELEAVGPPPGVHIDLRHLRHEQRDRATWLQRAWGRACDTDWDAVRAGARELLRPHRGSAGGSGRMEE
ncbi:DUF5984 family protein [Streptomyces sp. NPDC088251]|uniref:DUF5984 family protein n=1 Tax=unclassified Streptomyces TaxID=2593676 RepID=UPI0037F8ED8E